MDPRNRQLASVVCRHSINVQPGDIVGVAFRGFDATDLAEALVDEITLLGAIPHISYVGRDVSARYYKHSTKEQVRLLCEFQRDYMKDMDAFITVDAERNPAEIIGLEPERHKWYSEFFSKPVIEEIVLRRRWVLLRFPNAAMAKAARMPTRDFADFYYKVCTLDYGKMAEAMLPLKELMEKSERVRLVGPETDITFSIAGLPAIPCAGRSNLPDGELFTAPVKNSVRGKVTYNARTKYRGGTFENISFIVDQGRIEHAECNGNNKLLNEILDSDEGARYFGEFSLGFNPYIREPILDILFDEKIDGSFHLTPGTAYEECDNGNRSGVHWDLVNIQRPEWGGGEVYFDDVLIRKDGDFVLSELKPLSRERLLAP